MKSKCSFILKASLAMVLALVMLFGTVATSLAAVVEDDLADTAAQAEKIADTGADADVADEGAEADLADTSYSIGQMKKMYLKKSDGSWEDYTLSNGAYTVNITTAGTYNFKFYVDNGNYLTNTGNISNSVSGWQLDYMSDTTNPGSLNVSTTGNYTFTLTESSGNIYMSIAFPSSTPTPTEAPVVGEGQDITPAQYIYLRPNSDWLSDGARFAMYYWTGSNDAWIDPVSNSDGLYKFEVPTDSWGTTKNLKFERMNGSEAENIWNNKWNDSPDTTLTAGSDIWKITGWDTGEWEGTGYVYTISSAVSPANSGTVTETDANAGVDEDSTGQFTAVPASGYAFVNWTVPTGVSLATGITNTSSTIIFNADRAATLTANFVRVYTVTLPSIENATVSATYTNAAETANQSLTEGNTASVKADTNVVITVVPDANYKVTNIQGTAKTGLGNKTETIASIASDTVISAVVVEKTKYTVTTANNDSTLGTIGVNTSASDYTSSHRYMKALLSIIRRLLPPVN